MTPSFPFLANYHIFSVRNKTKQIERDGDANNNLLTNVIFAKSVTWTWRRFPIVWVNGHFPQFRFGSGIGWESEAILTPLNTTSNAEWSLAQTIGNPIHVHITDFASKLLLASPSRSICLVLFRTVKMWKFARKGNEGVMKKQQRDYFANKSFYKCK